MKKIFQKILIIFLFVAIVIPVPILVNAQTPQIFYISDVGNDNNDCSESNPCRSFSNTQQKAKNGDTIRITGYHAPIRILKGIIVENYGVAVIDGSLSNMTRCVEVGTLEQPTANGAIVRGLEVKNCKSHGIIVISPNVTIEYNYTHDAVTEGKTNGQFGSGNKCDFTHNVVFRYNTVERVWGEGFGITMCDNVQVYGNTVRNTKAALIYIDNTANSIVQNNFTSCFDTMFKGSNGRYPSGIGLSNEKYNYSPYFRNTAELENVTISNNIVYGCDVIANYFISNIPNVGARNVKVFHNTGFATRLGFGFDSGAGQTGIEVRNNLGTVWFQSGTGTSQSNNQNSTINMFLTTPNAIDPLSFTLKNNITVPNVGVLVDYFGMSRNNQPSIGAIEFRVDNVTLTPSLTSIPVTPSSTSTNTPNNIPVCVLITWDKLLNVRHSPSMFNAPYNVNISQNAIVPVQKIFDNTEGKWAQINQWMYFAMYLNSNNNTYAIEISCE